MMKYRVRLTMLLLLLIGSMPVYSQADAGGPIDESKLFKKLDQLSSEQIILVAADRSSSITGRLYVYEKQEGSWKRQLGPVPVVFGNNGLGKTKEGDGKTPLGTYTLGTAFGSNLQPPAGLQIDYRPAGADDYWVDTPQSPDYNSWVAYEGNPKERWSSFERLNHPLYQYAVVINYNTNPVIPGKGSAIFMHIWRAADKPTEGCIAMSKDNLLRVMKIINPDRSPKIRIGVGDSIY
ncbi:L,D-transpeptidase family protein [Paenibacillus hunanensis]|uniref:L,D-peptidoglycan transpeptidase YkuD (ErfK/YbiS/YcfS/YnhG family) n=1 Tax=Paenibacillus hunanensis TaxID=539262 RepID=A0ABU1IZQ0_9BACL|nr:L,D-transpeptidase family protein [Paenibacillus hunanensis]MDR6244639.1 L,D-peptidoglycan transpeptidase YkuD (ErfK/YbiS/YcfS/YnhG family) [Paenibacillus hunanensis]